MRQGCWLSRGLLRLLVVCAKKERFKKDPPSFPFMLLSLLPSDRVKRGREIKGRRIHKVATTKCVPCNLFVNSGPHFIFFNCTGPVRTSRTGLMTFRSCKAFRSVVRSLELAFLGVLGLPVPSVRSALPSETPSRRGPRAEDTDCGQWAGPPSTDGSGNP